MSIYGINSALWGVYTSPENGQQLREQPDDYIARFDLTPQEATAITAQDYAALLDMGAHPFLMYKMALRLEGRFSIEFLQRYLGRLRGHQLRDIVT
ncbi:hypothetical protein OVA06_09540 [Pseudarthrobacter sp. SL88]|uniref:hypothetical protein n=1 Tax=Pseudarthrobacter sp. SL88 TaxID=2994666 RepID=UPI0022738740|nr:hypothetical protein [Pseudarthrobacter sp. SL88]MCY1674948.1 hypothetical protein [Pseudarthrobacter sp. SL88]